MLVENGLRVLLCGLIAAIVSAEFLDTDDDDWFQNGYSDLFGAKDDTKSYDPYGNYIPYTVDKTKNLLSDKNDKAKPKPSPKKVVKPVTKKPTVKAVCILTPAKPENLENENNVDTRGVVFFEQSDDGHGKYGPVNIKGQIINLNPGKHGFHIHSYGDMTDPCKSQGGHYNPLKNSHGGPADDIEDRHIGDLGNAEANDKGVANLDTTDDVIQLSGKFSIIGRGCVVHKLEDDVGKGNNKGSELSGNSGPRYACGAVTLMAPEQEIPDEFTVI